jgi:hypothetical protein
MSSVGTKLDGNQVLKQAYDEPNNRLRVDATVSASIGTVIIKDNQNDYLNINADGSLNVAVTTPMAVEIDSADGDNIAISDGVDTMSVNADGSINIQGSVNASPSGLSVAGRITKVTINAVTWTPLPAIPLANRNGMTIQNRSGVPIYFEYNNTNPVGDGILLPNGGERFYDIKPSIILYASCSAGTALLYVEEIS